MATYGFLLLTFLVGLAYSIVAPLIVPFTGLLFFIGYICMKYQIFYVYDTKIETGGSWWPKVFNLVCICLAVFQTVTFGAMFLGTTISANINDGKIQYLLVAILPFLTGAFWGFIRVMVAPKAQYTKLNVANGGGGEESLIDRAFNPALVKPLPRVWVYSNVDSILP